MENNPNQLAQLKFQKDHNFRAFLEAKHPTAESHLTIINYLNMHRLRHALSKDVKIIESHLRGLWNIANIVNETIEGNILGHQLIIDEELIRRVLQLGAETNEDLVIYPENYIEYVLKKDGV